MIIDAHTHIFPPQVVTGREGFLAADSTFAELYAGPKAKLATATDLLASMDAAGIDLSVALGFAWSDAENVRLHNDYLLEAAVISDGRILPFCSLPLASGIDATESELRRCVAAGAPGFGELRPGNFGFDLAGEDGKRLGDLAHELDVSLLFHVSEPVGHAYPGKLGLDVGSFYAFVRDHPDVRSIGAHWGGGLPFYALMPEVRLALHNAFVDTAASSLLYDAGVYAQVAGLIGADSILFGSDYPLLSQARSRARIEAAVDADTAALILGANAQQLLKLE